MRRRTTVAWAQAAGLRRSRRLLRLLTLTVTLSLIGPMGARAQEDDTADRETKAVLPAETMFFKRVQDACLDAGLTVMAARGTVNSRQGDHLLLAPPLVMDKTGADQLAERLEAGVREHELAEDRAEADAGEDGHREVARTLGTTRPG